MGESDNRFHLETIILDSSATTADAIIEALANELVDTGYVKESYVEAVKAREQLFPTGLDTGKGIKVAIPHADMTHVIKPTIAFARMQEPVSFHSMENFQEQVAVSLVFMLAVKDPEKQVDTLQKLMGIFDQEDVLKDLLKSATKGEIKTILETIINS